jgi:hypothetical protein
MKYIIGVLLFCGILSVFGCYNPTGDNSGGPPSITILPENFHGEEYVLYTFKAKVSGLDPVLTYVKWYMEGTPDSQGIRMKINDPETVTYYYPATYTILLKAFDYYSDSMVASASKQITIDTALSSVEIIPQFYSGSLGMSTFGVTNNFALSVTTTLPNSELYQFWDYGDGTTDGYRTGATTHTFPSPGTYLLSVRVYQKNGIYVGRDTALITIDWPPFSVSSIKKMEKIEEYIFLDGTYPVDSIHLPQFPLNFGEPISLQSNWSGNTFTIEYADQYVNRKITGTLSDDGMKVDSMKFHILYSDPNVTASIDYEVFNMKLSFVTSKQIGFRISGENMKNNFTKFSYSGNFGVITNIGNPGSWHSFIRNNGNGTDPQCVLVFSQQ